MTIWDMFGKIHNNLVLLPKSLTQILNNSLVVEVWGNKIKMLNCVDDTIRENNGVNEN